MTNTTQPDATDVPDEQRFSVRFRYAESLSSEARQDLLERFIDEAIEAAGLAFTGGGGEQSCRGVVSVDMEDESATEDDRASVADWLGAEDGIAAYDVGPLQGESAP